MTRPTKLRLFLAVLITYAIMASRQTEPDRDTPRPVFLTTPRARERGTMSWDLHGLDITSLGPDSTTAVAFTSTLDPVRYSSGKYSFNGASRATPR
jgi:hypothetical protein